MQIDLFAGLPEAEIGELARVTVLRRYQAGSVVREPGALVDALEVVLDGRIRVFHRDPSGHEVTTNVLGRGHVVGACALPGAVVGAQGVWVAALGDTLVCAVPGRAFAAISARYPVVLVRVARGLIERVRAVEERLSRLTVGTVRARLANALVALARSEGAPLDTDGRLRRVCPFPTHQALANQIGTSRETVTRTLRAFAAEGRLRYAAHGTVIDVQLMSAATDVAGARRGCSARRRPVAATPLVLPSGTHLSPPSPNARGWAVGGTAPASISPPLAS